MENVLFTHPYLCVIAWIVWTVIFVAVWCLATHRFWRFKKKHPEVFGSGKTDESKKQFLPTKNPLYQTVLDTSNRFLPAKNPLYQTVSEKPDKPDENAQKECLRRQYNNNLLTSQFIIMVWGLGMFVPLVSAEFRWFLLVMFIFVTSLYVIAKLQK